MEAEGEIAQRQHKEGGRGKIQLGDFVVRIERPLRERKKNWRKGTNIGGDWRSHFLSG